MSLLTTFNNWRANRKSKNDAHAYDQGLKIGLAMLITEHPSGLARVESWIERAWEHTAFDRGLKAAVRKYLDLGLGPIDIGNLQQVEHQITSQGLPTVNGVFRLHAYEHIALIVIDFKERQIENVGFSEYDDNTPSIMFAVVDEEGNYLADITEVRFHKLSGWKPWAVSMSKYSASITMVSPAVGGY